MTPKILSLEEIEKIEKFRKEMIELEPEPCELGVWQVEISRFNRYQLQDLLATARAYWEMFAIYNDNPSQTVTISEDKPHAPTIKVIMEALGYIKHVDNSTGAELAIKSLEKHLE